MRWFADLFKEPAFLRLPAAAIDISDRSIKYMELKRVKDGNFVPAFYEKKSIKDGIVKNGDIQSVEALSEELSYFRKKYRNFTFAHISLPEELSYSFAMDLDSGLNEKEAREKVEFSLAENIPFNPENTVFGIDKIKNKEHRTLYSVVVYPEDIVREYIEAVNSAGFTVKSAELETVSMSRAVVPKLKRFDGEPRLLLDFGNEKVGVLVSVNGASVFSSTIDFNPNEYFKALYEEFYRTENKHDFKQDEFYAWKFRRGFLSEGLEYRNKNYMKFIDEIRQIVKFYNKEGKQNGCGDIKEIYLSGGNAATKALGLAMSYDLQTPVYQGNSWENLLDLDDYIPDIDRQESFMYSTLIGLLLKDVYYE